MEIYLLRHGEAESAPPGTSDADRSLTAAGREAIRKVLTRCRQAGVAPSLILTSPYLRAVQTAELAADILGVREEIVRTAALLPASSPEDVWAEIRIRPQQRCLLLAGHEPLLSFTLAHLLGTPTLRVDFKKAAIAALELKSLPASLQWMLTPKLA